MKNNLEKLHWVNMQILNIENNSFGAGGFINSV